MRFFLFHIIMKAKIRQGLVLPEGGTDFEGTGKRPAHPADKGAHPAGLYPHYDDIYDLLQQIEEDMLRDFQQALAPLLEADLEMLSPLQITTGIYRCLKDNADLCTVTLGEHGDKDFALRLVSIGRESYLRAYSRQFPAATRRQLEYFYAFASGGHMGLLRQWVEEGMAASPEEMALAAENIMRYGMEFLQAAQS